MKVYRNKMGAAVLMLWAAVAGGAHAQSSFVFIDEELPTTNATEHIAETGVWNDTDGELLWQNNVVGPNWESAASTSAVSFHPKSAGVAMCQSSAAPRWQPKVDLLTQYGGQTWIDPFYLNDMASVEAGTVSRIRKGLVNQDITPPENFPGTPCRGADWRFEFGNNTQWGGFNFSAGLWYSPRGTHWRDARLLAEIYGSNGLIGSDIPMQGELDDNGNVIGSTGWLIINYGGQFSPGVYYSDEPDHWWFEDRFPQIQPDMTLWWMGAPFWENGRRRPRPHADFWTTHYLLGYGAGNYGTAVNQGQGFYKFSPSLLSSWNGAGADE